MDPKAEAKDIHHRREGKMSKSAAKNKAIVLEAFETVYGLTAARRKPAVEIADVPIRGMNCRTSDSRSWTAHVLLRLQ